MKDNKLSMIKGWHTHPDEQKLWSLYAALQDDPNINQTELRAMVKREVLKDTSPHHLIKQLNRLAVDIHKNLKNKSLDYILGLEEKW